MKYYNCLNRAILLMSLLKSQNNSDFLTIKNISHTFQLPIELIRFDIQVLFSNKFYQSRLSIHLDDEKELYNFKNHFKIKLISYFGIKEKDFRLSCPQSDI